MKIRAIVEKRIYGTLELEIPDEQLIDASYLAKKRRINKAVETAVQAGTVIQWDSEEQPVTYNGNYMVMPEYLTKDQVRDLWETKPIVIEFADSTDALAQENGYTLEQCLAMTDVRFFVDQL